MVTTNFNVESSKSPSPIFSPENLRYSNPQFEISQSVSSFWVVVFDVFG